MQGLCSSRSLPLRSAAYQWAVLIQGGSALHIHAAVTFFSLFNLPQISSKCNGVANQLKVLKSMNNTGALHFILISSCLPDVPCRSSSPTLLMFSMAHGYCRALNSESRDRAILLRGTVLQGMFLNKSFSVPRSVGTRNGH